MEAGESKEDIYRHAKGHHETLDRRLNMLLRKAYLSPAEEMEIKVLKKRKLYCKDIMERTREELKRERQN